jgi:uncharacterized protein YerC
MSTNKWCEKEIKELVLAVSSASTPYAVNSLFEVVLTPRELNDMAKRLKIKKMLEEGSSYQHIETALNVSPAIISRISSHIGYGFRRSYAQVGEEENQFVKKTKKHRELSPTSLGQFNRWNRPTI